MNQANPKMDLQQHPSASDVEVRNTDIARRNTSSRAGKSSLPAQNPSANTVHDRNNGNRPDTADATSVTQSPSPSRTASTSHRASPAREPQGFIRLISGIFQSPVTDSTNSHVEKQLRISNAEIERLQEALREKENIIRKSSKEYQRDANRMWKELQETLDEKSQEWETERSKYENYIKQTRGDQDEKVHRLQAEMHEIESDRRRTQQQYDEFIRKQQEESFKQMESARWLPTEGRKVVGDLDRIKRDIRSWAKGTAIKDMSAIKALGEEESTDLMKELSCVVLLENNALPKGLSTPKSPSLLLNALLAHDIYTNLFRNPFFFLQDEFGNDSPRAGLDDSLDKIYHSVEASNQQDAHMWRSQTLRLLLPPMRTNSSEGEKKLHSCTEGLIAQVSERHASHFISSSARHFINKDTPGNPLEKLKAIYYGAATVSYQLWTRRTKAKCITLCEMGHPTFDSDSTSLVPHTLVRYDLHEDLLRGRPITVIVHPLLKVFGTDDGQDYDQETVWAPAEVWLDSKVVSNAVTK